MWKKTKRVHRRLNSVLDRHLKSLRRNCLRNTDFSIICNNCWGGYVYRRYGLPYLTPTVGLYFFADDFIKLCSDVKGYMNKALEFISYTESKYSEIIEARKQTNVPIARLGDIEVVFLHYKTKEEAAEKWNRRVGRINYENLIFKFSKMNGCTEEHLKRFDQFDFSKRICFIPPDCGTDIQCGVLFKSAVGSEEIENDTSEYSRYINLRKMINSAKVCGTHVEGRRTKK